MLLVTGNLGFIGKHLTKLLDKEKINWIGYDLVEGYDIRDKQKLDAFFEKNQITDVIHLAALAGVRRGNEYPDEYISTNINGTYNVVKLSEKYKIKHFIFYSSSSVYGQGKPPITENHKKEPLSLYGITKLAGEKIVKSSIIKQKTIILPFTVYGENGRKDEVLYKWLEQYKNNLPITVYGDGTSKRGYVYIKDLVESTIKIFKDYSGSWGYEDFNLGGSEVIELKSLIDLFKKIIPSVWVEIEQRQEYDVYCNYASTVKANHRIGFNPKPYFMKNVENIIVKEIKDYSFLSL